MADFAQLVLAVDARPVQAGEAALNSLATTAERTEARTGGAMRGIGAAAGVGTNGLRNLGLQLGQVTQQGAVTGNYLQALAIQMPDILMSFGAWGIGLGVVAGALSGIVPALIGATDRIADLDEAISSLSAATRDYRRAADDLNYASIRDDFGGVTAEVVRLRERLVELRLVEVMVAAGEAADALAQRFDGFGRTAQARLADLFTLQRSIDGNQMARGFREVADAFEALSEARGVQDQATAASALVDALRLAGFHTENATDDQREFYRQALESENALRLAASAAEGLAGATGTAADNAGRLSDNARAALDALSQANALRAALDMAEARGGGRGADPRLFMDGRGGTSPGRFVYTGPELVQDETGAWVPRPTRTGSGGMSEAQRRHMENLREAQRIYDATRTSAERYAAELADLNELHASGYLDAETHARAVQQIEDAYNEAGDAAREWAQDMAGHFDGLITGGRNLSDVLQSMARQLESRGWQLLFQSLSGAGGGGKGGGGGLFNFFRGLLSFDGGGYTGAGSRTGGIDGKGGFLSILHPDETVFDHTRQSTTPQGVHVTVSAVVDDRGTIMPVVQSVVQRATPGIVRQAVGATYQSFREVRPQ